MRAVVQRVTEGRVTVEGELVGSIGPGLVVLVGVEKGDTDQDMIYITDKIAGLRIFCDAEDKMNLSVTDIGGSVLWISQFTLLGDARHGRRPSFTDAEAPDLADALYQKGTQRFRDKGIPVETGCFQTDMKVSLVNDGPVTMLLDSRKRF